MRRRTRTVVAACCLATLIVKLWANADASTVAHGDAAYYTTLARNLAGGRGFFIDYVPDYLSWPCGVPHPANSYWLPLPSMICAIGVAIGGPSYVAARIAMSVFTSVAPWVAYLFGRDAFGSPRAGLVAAILATTFPPLVIHACRPTTQGAALVVGGLALWAILRSRKDIRFLPWCGLLIALAHYNRSDAPLFFAALWIARLSRGPGRSIRHTLVHTTIRLWPAAVVYALVMTPLWTLNLRNTAAPLPTGPARLALATQYTDLYAPPGTLTWERFIDQGAGPLVARKLRAARRNAAWLGSGAWRAGTRHEAPFVSHGATALCCAVWVGWLFALRRRQRPMWILAGALWLLYGFVFTETGRVSFRVSLFALYPIFLAGAGRALVVLAEALSRAAPLGRWRAALRAVALGIPLLWITVAGLVRAEEQGRTDAAWSAKTARFHTELDRRVLGPAELEGALVMSWDVHELHANTGLRLVQLPHGSEPAVRRTARALGVTHVLLPGSPGSGWTLPATIARSPHYQLLAGERVRGREVRLYRLRTETACADL